jgi:hypothetical protein
MLMQMVRLTGATPPISKQHLFQHLLERTAMFVLFLKKDGAIYHKESAVDSDVLKYLSYQIRLEDPYTLRSFFKRVEKYEVLGRLNSFLPTCIEQYLNCPQQGCESETIDHLEFAKTVEMIGVPKKRLEIYSAIRGMHKSDSVEIRSLQLTSLLDMPLKLGRLKHVVFGDRVDIFEFDTVFTLFEFIDGITWELSFHVIPEQCELRR